MTSSARRRLLSTAALAYGGIWLVANPPGDRFPVETRIAPAPQRTAVAPPPGTRAAMSWHPQPTEHRLPPDAEADNKSRRKQWFREQHRAPDGVDWKALERANGLAQIAKRNALAGAPPPAADELTWVERGSENQAGRMHVARPGTDGGHLYAGSSLGGVWRGTTAGEDWTPLGDNLYGGAHWLEVTSPPTAGDPDVILAATDSGLIHWTADEGVTWTVPTGLGDTGSVRRLIQQSDGSETLWLLYWAADHYSLARSDDGGVSFTELLDLGEYAGDLWTPRDGGGTLYLADDDALFSSADGGDTWTEAGQLGAGSGRIELVGSEAGAPRLWAVVDGRALWRSDDAGETWVEVHSVSDYWGSLNASMLDPDLFAWGGVEVWVTRNAGDDFDIVNAWWEYYYDPANTLHADIPGLDVIPTPDGGETWYICTDGGLFESHDGLETVANLSLTGLRVSQYYDVHTSRVNPDHVIAGAQDQGYQVTSGVEQSGDEVLEFDQIISGDYGHLTSSDGSHDLVYSVYPTFVLIQEGEEDIQLHYASFPAGEDYVPWLPPIVADPDDEEAFFFPAGHLYRYRRSGNDWRGQPYSAHDFSIDTAEYISVLAFSPVDVNRAWAATSHGRLWISDDKGVTWTQSQSLVADDNWYYGQAIAPSLTDPDTVTIGGSGYGVPAVYRSTDGGVSFRPWSEGLPDTLVYGLAEAPDGSGVVFAGTSTAAYMRGPEDDEWVDVTGAWSPVTIYWSVEGLAHETTMRFATYGRGIWELRLDPDGDGCWQGVDADADGFSCHEDCDEGDATVYPNADEICDDDIDQDCDGSDLACEGPGDSDAPTDTAPPEDTGPPEDSDPTEPVAPDPPEVDAGGCGCSAGGSGALPAGLLALVGLVGVRRRR